MEFPFDVNYVLPYEVTIFDGDYRILNHGQTTRGLYVLKIAVRYLLQLPILVVLQRNYHILLMQ
jgi:hypothetical protein